MLKPRLVMYHHNNTRGGLTVTERRRYHWQYRSSLRNHRLELRSMTQTQSLQGFGRPAKQRGREQGQRTWMAALGVDSEHTNTAQFPRIASWAAVRSAGGHSSARHFMTPVTQTSLLHQQALSEFEQPVWSPSTTHPRVQPNQKLGEVPTMCQKRGNALGGTWRGVIDAEMDVTNVKRERKDFMRGSFSRDQHFCFPFKKQPVGETCGVGLSFHHHDGTLVDVGSIKSRDPQNGGWRVVRRAKRPR